MHPAKKRYIRALHGRSQHLNSSNDHRQAISKFVSLHVVVFWVMTACSLVGSVFETRRNIMFYVCRPFVFRRVGTQATDFRMSYHSWLPSLKTLSLTYLTPQLTLAIWLTSSIRDCENAAQGIKVDPVWLSRMLFMVYALIHILNHSIR